MLDWAVHYLNVGDVGCGDVGRPVRGDLVDARLDVLGRDHNARRTNRLPSLRLPPRILCDTTHTGERPDQVCELFALTLIPGQSRARLERGPSQRRGRATTAVRAPRRTPSCAQHRADRRRARAACGRTAALTGATALPRLDGGGVSRGQVRFGALGWYRELVG